MQRPRLPSTTVGIILFGLLLAGCIAPPAPLASATAAPAVGEPGETYAVNITPADFVKTVDNPYFPLAPGSKYVYEGMTEEGVERVEVQVLPETRLVIGIRATVVRDTVYLDGQLIEDTYDWYAQDKAGNVWYLGEDVRNYENSRLKDTAGSWEAGADGALPGIIMVGKPTDHVGETYRQEYYQGHAEDMADLVSVDESVSVPYGSFDAVLLTKDHTPLEPGLAEHKYYAKGIGMVKSVDLDTGEEIVLIELSAP